MVRRLAALGIAATAFLGLAMSCATGRGGPLPSPQCREPVLRVTGRHFTDPAGRVVILRGVNLSGGAKVPPFHHVSDVSCLDRLPALGFNVIRLVFIWEAFEPSPGVYDETYLARMQSIADAAWERGLYVIVDIHQDGFSRNLSRGSGDGFPLWAISRRATAAKPDNGPGCKAWAVFMATDPGMHRSFADFYSDAAGVRSRYLLMLGRVAEAFVACPGVIGYDLINEPWGDERTEIAPLYRDAARVVHGVDPTAILFLEGHVTTNCGLQTKLPRPEFGNVVYAPHYYQPTTIYRNGWRGRTWTIDRAFANMEEKAEEWGVPLFLSEYGAPAEADQAGEYVRALHDRLDNALASGTQWNFTPTWTEDAKDGWNTEDFNILSPDGHPRPNFNDRPYPRSVAGSPVRFHYHSAAPPAQGHHLDFTWDHRPESGLTEIHVPGRLFPPDSVLTVEGEGASVWRVEDRQLLVCRSTRPGTTRVRLTAP